MTKRNYAAIDIGSNAIRLLISSFMGTNKESSIEKIVFIRVPIRLGEDVFSDCKIGAEKKAKLMESMRGFKSMINVFEVESYMACATSAMREAVNGKAICSEIMSEVGLTIDIISGESEAEMIFNSGMKESLGIDKNYLYVDVGGGSTEITIYSNHEVVDSRSFSIGTVRMLKDAVDKDVMSNMKKWLKYIALQHQPVAIIGSGGNINKTLRLLNKKDREAINYQELKVLHDYIKSLTFDERIEKMKMNSDRADVIVPAQKIFMAIMKSCNIDEVYAPKMGLVDGIINKLLSKSTHVE